MAAAAWWRPTPGKPSATFTGHAFQRATACPQRIIGAGRLYLPRAKSLDQRHNVAFTASICIRAARPGQRQSVTAGQPSAVDLWNQDQQVLKFSDGDHMSRSVRTAFACLCITALLTGCTMGSPNRTSPPNTALSAAASPSVPSTCHVTHPTDTAVPKGVAELRYGPVVGQGPLWVGAWWTDPATLDEARRKDLGGDSKHPYGVKYPTSTIRGGQATNALGRPRIHARRLDGQGDAIGQVGGYAEATLNNSNKTIHFWPTTIRFSEHGCWEVTESIEAAEIAYIIRL